MENSNKVITFEVTRRPPELIAPAKPTTHEFKLLSDIDDQEGLRFQVPVIQFYRRNPSTEGKDPVKVIRDAIAKALVFYYPFAGRLRERGARQLVVECTGEGVLFIEADADVALQQLDDALYPPFPYLDKLLYDIPCTAGIINCPLLLIQVTRLTCGGFAFAMRLNHSMSDGAGLVQFMLAVGEFELARGAEAPSVQPVWERHLLTARHPPHVSFAHREYDIVRESDSDGRTNKLVQGSIFFSPADIAALRCSLPPHLQSCTKFEVMAGCAWRCHTIALSPKYDEEMRFLCAMNIRKRMDPQLPEGYYGNVVAFPAAVTTAEELSKNPLQYAVELVRKAKYKATDEYVRSTADLMVMRERPSFTAARTYLVSDLTNLGFEHVDFGWGTAAYGGAARAIQNQINWYTPFKNKKGEGGTMVPVCLPRNSMEVFVKQLRMMMGAPHTSSALRIMYKGLSRR